MSNWSQVAMIFRIDYVDYNGDGELNFEDIFGKPHLWEDDYDEYLANPSAYLPMGSEGSLEMSVWTNPNDSYTCRYTVSIFGSLRDHERENVVELLEWFDKKCKLLEPRQAVITIDNSLTGVITKTYDEE